MAFYAGSFSSIPIIQSFCVHCALTITFLYITVMTLFLSAVFWDSYRVSKKCGECFGLFFCSENSLLFCKGKLLSDAQKKYSGIIENKDVRKFNPQPDIEDESVVASRTEQVLLTKVTPCLLNNKVKACILLFYVGFTIFCLYGVFSFKTYFSMDLLVNEEYNAYDYL